jgi:hypothetical protein
MKIFRILSATVLSAALLPAFAIAQNSAPIGTSTSSNHTAGTPNWSQEQLITASVHEAWVLSGKNEATFFEMVTQLAELSASKRGLTLPDTTAAGRRMGELIKTQAKLDTSQLLYVVVDKAVQKIGVPAKS